MSKSMKSYYVYILSNHTGTLYAGMINNLMITCQSKEEVKRKVEKPSQGSIATLSLRGGFTGIAFCPVATRRSNLFFNDDSLRLIIFVFCYSIIQFVFS